MAWLQALLFWAFLSVVWCAENLQFPSGFQFGAASAAYQVEGSWNTSGKGESIWDRFTHNNSEAITDRTNGDVACDSYNLWKRDIEMAKELKLHYYRFSIAWPRILPNGFSNIANKAGIKYYSDLIDGLLAEGIDVMVTMYHWDLPQPIQDLGGWTNPKIVDWFGDYVRILYTCFGKRVKHWLTINEPVMVCDESYNYGDYAPGIVNADQGAYLCNKNLLLAHARAYRIYEEEFKQECNGKISIANNLMWFQPLTEHDMELTELVHQNLAGRYSHPIYTQEGGWPVALEIAMAKYSNEKGYAESLLPSFTEEEIKYIRGTYDFYAFNYYTSRTVRRAKKGEVLKPWVMGDAPNVGAVLGTLPDWPTESCDIKINPKGLRNILVWLKEHYGNMDYYITENGLCNHGGLNDLDRIDFLNAHMKQLLLAINEDGVNVTHYTVWSLMDDFEWTSGYSERFGLYEVDFQDPKRTRTPRASAKYFANVIKHHSLIPSEKD